MTPSIWFVVGLLALVVLFAWLAYFMFGSFFYGAGYQPTPAAVRRWMLDFCALGPDDRVYELGAGTGGLLFGALDAGAGLVVGVELEPVRFAMLRSRQKRHPHAERVELRKQDLFQVDLKDASVVMTFLWPAAMRRLAPKFQQELRPGARVVTYYHPIPGWKAERSDEKLKVYGYRVPSAFSSSSSSAPAPGSA